MEEDYFPLIFTTLGREEWLKKHPITITLPETEVVASKPLTEFELRDKRNAVRLGLIEDSDDAYRLWKNKVHKANLRDKTIGTIGAGTAMGLASIFTMANPASLYAYGAMGVSNFPNLVDKIKYDIDTGLYAGAAADVGLTAMELLPAALVTSPIWMPAVKGAVRLGDRLYRKASPYYDLYRTILETDPAEALLKLLFFNLTKAPKLSNITLEKDFEAAMNDPTYRFGNLRHLTNLDNGYKTPNTERLSVMTYEPAPAQTYVTLSDFPLQLVNGKLVKSDKAFFGTNIGLMPNRPYYDVNVPKKSRITYIIDADKVPETKLYTGLNNFTYPTVGYLPSLHTTMVKYDPVLKLFVPSRFVMPSKSLTDPSKTIFFEEIPSGGLVGTTVKLPKIESKAYEIGDKLPAENGVSMEVNPYLGSTNQLYNEAINYATDALLYPESPYFMQKVKRAGIYNDMEIPLLQKELQDFNLFGGISIKSYDEGLHVKGLNQNGQVDEFGNIQKIDPFDSNGNILFRSAISINPDFAGGGFAKTITYHELGGHGFNARINGNEDPNIVLVLAKLRLSGLSDASIYSGAKSFLVSKGMSAEEAADNAWGYLFATKYPKIYKMLRYNYLKLLQILKLQPGVDLSTPLFKYKTGGDEVSARARSGNIEASISGSADPIYTADIQGLEDVYTPESLREYLKIALGLSIPLTLGTTYGVSNSQPQSYKLGNKIKRRIWKKKKM